MDKDHYPFYGVALAAGAALAVWAGMPVAFLLFLVCPLMMFFMMKGMRDSTLAAPSATPVTPPVEDQAPLTAVLLRLGAPNTLHDSNGLGKEPQ